MDATAVMGTVLGAAIGAGTALALAPAVRRRGGRAFWGCCVAAFVLGIAVAAWGLSLSLRSVALAGLAASLSFATALKWMTGRVPGVRADDR